MILQKKQLSFRLCLKSFTLIEALTALFIISVAVLSISSVMTSFFVSTQSEKQLQEVLELGDNYFKRLYLASDLKEELFSEKETLNLKKQNSFPYIVSNEETNLAKGIRMVIEKKIIRFDPLLVDVTIHFFIKSKEKSLEKKYTLESIFSESYLNKLQ